MIKTLWVIREALFLFFPISLVIDKRVKKLLELLTIFAKHKFETYRTFEFLG